MFLDLAKPFQLGFQDSATPIMSGITDLHHKIFFFLIIILIPVLYIFYQIVLESHYLWLNPTKEHVAIYRKDILSLNALVHASTLEIVWTILPAIILMFISIPSFSLLYSLDEILDASYTYKAIGNQWYWHYETPANDAGFDSYLKSEKDLSRGELRLLEVDHPLTVPALTHLRFIITASDVLHSFAVPSLGIKVDAVPGRLNAISAYILREGFFTGACSELCGVNHGFMPINVVAIHPTTYAHLLSKGTIN